MNTHSQDNAERQAAALAQYHAHYNNDSYRAVQVALIADLYGEPFAHDTRIREQLLGEEIPYFLMNLLSDVALEICVFPGMNGKWQMLVNEIALRRLSPETVRLMSQHLEHFEDDGSTFSADFENIALHAEVHCETLWDNRSQLKSLARHNVTPGRSLFIKHLR